MEHFPALALTDERRSKGSESFEFAELGIAKISHSNDSDPFDLL
jgi:hypothetical protein